MTRLDEIERLARLKEQGVLTEDEFQREKTKVLGRTIVREDVRSALDHFVDSLSVFRERITKRGAYIGVMTASVAFAVSLFFSWSQIRTGVSAADSGSRSGWADAGYVAALPLLIIVYRVVKDEALSVKSAVLLGASALLILMFNNVLNRTTWVGVQYMGLITNDAGKDMGSELGVGFWIGLVSLLGICTCGISWAAHTTRTGTSS